MTTLALALELDSGSAAVEVELPDGPQPAEALLPAMYAVDDRVIAATVAAQPRAVSCRKGCSACCRAQPVPVTPAEARALAAWVDAQAPARRDELKARFADRVARLDAAGLRPRLDGRAPPRSAAEARAIAADYLQLGLVCPFLDDDACSVHDRRPFVCRQYLVTSPAEACADPLARPVAVVRLPIQPAHALLDATRTPDAPPPRTLPLVLALAHDSAALAAPHQDPTQTFTRWLSALASGRAADPPIR